MVSYDDLINRARIASKNNDYETAKDLYLDAFEIQINVGDLYDLGTTYYQLENYKEALNCYLKVIEATPDIAIAYYSVGYIYTLLQNYHDAIYYYQEAIKRKSDFTDAHISLAMAYESLQDDDKAFEAYLNVLKFDPNNFFVNHNIGAHYMQQGNLEKSLEHLLKAYNQNSDTDNINYNLGLLHYKLNNFDEAIKYYKLEIEREDANPLAYLNIAILYKDELKKNDLSKYYYLKGIERYKDYADLWYNLGCLYAIQDDYENAYNCLMYAFIKDISLIEYSKQDSELDEFRKSDEFIKLKNQFAG